MSATSIRGLIANDAYAITFQTMGQYRTALLRAIDAAPQPQGGALTDEQIREVAVDYCRFVFPGVYSIREFDCEEDFFNCVRAIVAQSAPSAPQQAGDGLTREQLAVFRDVTDDLECELQTRYKGYPDNDRRRVRDFAVVQRARAILAAPRQPGEMGAGVPDYANMQHVGVFCNVNSGSEQPRWEQMQDGYSRADGVHLYRRKPTRVDLSPEWCLAAAQRELAASVQQDEHCQCHACAFGTIHASDCAVHNEPAYPNGLCDCGAQQDEREARPVAWTVNGGVLRTLAAELMRAAESMGEDSDEMVLEVRRPGTVEDDDRKLNTTHVLAVSLAEYPEEGVYPINPADPTGGRAAQQVQADAGAVLVSRADLDVINAAMQHLGDVLNGMDAVEAEDEEKTEPGFEAINRILAAHPSPAGESDKRDAERFVLLCGALAAELNGEKLSGVHESLRGCLEEMGAPISIDVMREAIDRAAMSRENSEGGEHE